MSTTELTTFTGNWADFSGIPVINGKELSDKSKEQFDRACAIAKEIRDYGQKLGIDFNRKYIVEKNGQQCEGVDYEKTSDVDYPAGGCVGDMVFFNCIIRAGIAPAGQSLMGKLFGSSKKNGAELELKEVTFNINLKTISKSGFVPQFYSFDWMLYLGTKGMGVSKALKESFESLHNNILGRDDYAIRPLTEAEIAQYPDVNENEKVQGVVSRIVPF
ncbi:MAG: hypothetical protein J5848_01915 [Bacteroidales bacterium]|nr:hypothetical protein [Bacteroidales bacterium]